MKKNMHVQFYFCQQNAMNFSSSYLIDNGHDVTSYKKLLTLSFILEQNINLKQRIIKNDLNDFRLFQIE